MNNILKIVHLDDSVGGVITVKHALNKSKLNTAICVAATKEQFAAALADFSPDIILSEYALQGLHCSDAIALLQESGLQIPFIIVSNAISDEMAEALLSIDADDYVLKDQIGRLPFTITKSLEKFQIKRGQQDLLGQLTNSEKRFRTLIENSIDAVLVLNAKAEPMYVSPAVKNVLGYTPQEVMDMNIFSMAHPDDMAELPKVMEKVIANPGVPIQGHTGRMLHKDGSWRWIEAIVTNLLHEPTINGIVDNFRDVTDKIVSQAKEKEADERALKALEEKNYILESIGEDLIASNKRLEQFSYIVSHNLRAPVANIIGLGALLREDSYPWQVKQEFLDGIVENVKRLDDIILDLNAILQIKREVSEKREAVDMQQLVNDIRSSIQHIVDKEKVAIEADFSDINEIYTLKSYLHSIFYNLIMNSIKYRQRDLSPVIRIKSGLANGQVIISVDDNGLGIDLAKKGTQLFGLYKRFHHHVEGKGMGLFMVKTQVEMLGGRIAVNSTVDKGTAFQIELGADACQIPAL
ncbi:PAS domain S-box protein [Dyadobacter sp. CY326]|uniref:sensor histidine kinase n=1 Tax=Dyadobacter sp. CY326 TaxID=2907300 RepID=UPI001F44611C|nr:PAS domain S-box protein [Dyadobacter sp. CY326]MCE7065016.1 PAS domain S-box protein [Dyadobacter sp. CY326]